MGRGAKLTVYEEMQNRAISDEYEAVYRYHEYDRLIVVQCAWLYDNYDRLSLGSRLNISYGNDLTTFRFIGRAKEKLRGNGLVMIEQLTDVETTSRRQFDRDELRVSVAIFGLHESKITATSFERPEGAPELTDVSFDISSGGACIVTNTLLSSKHDPYYLLVFNITDRDSFALPSKLVRRSNYPHTKHGRYDYGFQFMYDRMPDEKSRLTRAILNRKISTR
jgi:c-di-GMP-binding flagellar brake protein YcgR